MLLIRINVDEVRGTIASLITDWVANQAWSNIGEVVRSIVMPIVTVWRAVLRQYGTRSKEDEAKIGCRKNSQHGVPCLGALRPRTIRLAVERWPATTPQQTHGIKPHSNILCKTGAAILSM